MGVSDVELQQDIMVVDDLTLDEAVKMAEAKETAKKSVDTLEAEQTPAAISAFKKQLLCPKVLEDQCRNCGEKRHKSKDLCPAIENKCSCGLKGHFKRYCYTEGKLKKKKEPKKEEEAGNQIQDSLEGCFSLTAGRQEKGRPRKTNGGFPGSLPPPEKKHPLPLTLA